METKKKIAFNKSDLEKFMKDSTLILKENVLNNLKGGSTFRNYAESTFANYGGIKH